MTSHSSPAVSGPEVVIIGAGPAGLTAATEVAASGGRPLIVELEGQVGGLCRTVEHHGNRIDIGGHRFFSRDRSVMDWWLDVLPLQGAPARDDLAMAREVALSSLPRAPDPETDERVMLSRPRLSRIFFLRRFFDYPLSLDFRTLRMLGIGLSVRIAGSYVAARLRPIRPEKNLEDYLVNHFGRVLAARFFEAYTQKLWGVPCTEIGPEWGAQRIRGLTVGRVMRDAVSAAFGRAAANARDTSLIRHFLYPKYGPGQLWESVAESVEREGGTVLLRHEVVGLRVRDGRVTEVRVRDLDTGAETTCEPAAVLSSMPLSDLVARIEGDVPPERVRDVASRLPYRDFMTCGLLVRRMKIGDPSTGRIPDDWLYIQDRDVRLARLQVFNNWSPYLVTSDETTWLGLEYTCQEGDEMWSSDDAAFTSLAVDELSGIGLIDADDVLDSVVLRVKKAYPGYFGAYADFAVVRDYVDSIEGLYVMGRNGMHRYNNMDHSMLSARAAVRAACGEGTREQVWAVNADRQYQESDASGDDRTSAAEAASADGGAG